MVQAHAESWQFTVEQFYQLFEQGVLPEDAPVELIEGQIVMRPKMNPPHRTAVMHGTHALMSRFMTTHFLRVQLPLTLNDISEPVPDFAVVSKEDFEEADRPPRVDLLLEVSDSSLAYDRDEKASLYARCGIPEYWIVNVKDQVLEIHRDPQPDSSRVFGYGWGSTEVLPRTAQVAPRFAPDTPVAVDELF